MSRKGNLVWLTYPELIDIYYRGKLVAAILAMPQKNPISLESASRILSEKRREFFGCSNFGEEPGQYGWYAKNFVSWISSLGYHIELTGDEFDAHAMPSHIS